MYDTLSRCKNNDCLASESLLHEDNSSFPLYTQHAVLFLLVYTVARVLKITIITIILVDYLSHLFTDFSDKKIFIALLLKL